ncbi:MAG: polymorphic toxin-type HINT domain-containing protein, partial [Polyangiaceae bacterium]
MECRAARRARTPGRGGRTWGGPSAPAPTQARRGTSGAVYVEFLIAFLPFFTFFLCLWQASIAYSTKLLVDHAAFAAARAGAVIVAENPHRVDPNGGDSSVNTLTKSRADYVRTAAEIALAPSIMDGTIVLVDVKFPPGDQPGGADAASSQPSYPTITNSPVSLMRVRVEAWMVCKVALANAIMCPVNTVLGFFAKEVLGSFILPVRSEAVFPYQGASYTYDPNDDTGRAGRDAVASNLGSMCFSAGTAVDTPLGPRPIEAVHAGDAVLSRDEATGAVRTERVLRTFVTRDQPLVEVRLRGSDVLRATPTHLFGTTDRGWVAASQLEAGEPILAEGGGEVEVEGVTPLDVRETVYNFEVEDTHTYFVGAAKAWVHNNGCDSAIPGGGSLPGPGGGGASAGGGGSSSGGRSTANPAKGTSLAQNLNQQLAIEAAEANP